MAHQDRTPTNTAPLKRRASKDQAAPARSRTARSVDEVAQSFFTSGWDTPRSSAAHNRKKEEFEGTVSTYSTVSSTSPSTASPVADSASSLVAHSVSSSASQSIGHSADQSVGRSAGPSAASSSTSPSFGLWGPTASASQRGAGQSRTRVARGDVSQQQSPSAKEQALSAQSSSTTAPSEVQGDVDQTGGHSADGSHTLKNIEAAAEKGEKAPRRRRRVPAQNRGSFVNRVAQLIVGSMPRVASAGDWENTGAKDEAAAQVHQHKDYEAQQTEQALGHLAALSHEGNDEQINQGHIAQDLHDTQTFDQQKPLDQQNPGAVALANDTSAHPQDHRAEADYPHKVDAMSEASKGDHNTSSTPTPSQHNVRESMSHHAHKVASHTKQASRQAVKHAGSIGQQSALLTRRGLAGLHERYRAYAQKKADQRKPGEFHIGILGKQALILIAVALFCVIALYNPCRTYYQEYRAHQRLESKYAQLNAYRNELETEVKNLQTPEGIEDAAREELGMVREGEHSARVNGISAEDELKMARSIKGTAPVSWWTTILDAIFRLGDTSVDPTPQTGEDAPAEPAPAQQTDELQTSPTHQAG